MLRSLSASLQAAAAWVFSPAGSQWSSYTLAPPMRDQRRHEGAHRTQAGFTIIELMIVMAVAAVISGIAAPNLSGWMRIYRLKSATMNLYTGMQLARVNAIKENREWRILFNDPNRTYTLIRCLTSTCETGVLNTDYQIFRTVDLKTTYRNIVQYKHPLSQPVFGNNPLQFFPSGLTNSGYIYFSNDKSSAYYRVGSDSLAGGLRVQRYISGVYWE